MTLNTTQNQIKQMYTAQFLEQKILLRTNINNKNTHKIVQNCLVI